MSVGVGEDEWIHSDTICSLEQLLTKAICLKGIRYTVDGGIHYSVWKLGGGHTLLCMTVVEVRVWSSILYCV